MVIWDPYLSHLLQLLHVLIYLLLVNYDKIKGKHRLEHFATDRRKVWWICRTPKQWSCLEYSHKFVSMPLQKLSVTRNKTVAQCSYFQANCYGSSNWSGCKRQFFKRNREFPSSPQKIWRGRGRKYHLQVLLKMTLFALFELTHLWYPVRLHSSQYQRGLSYDNFGVFWYHSGCIFPPRENMLHVIPYGWIEETFLSLLVEEGKEKRNVKEMYMCLTQSQLNGLSDLCIQ